MARKRIAKRKTFNKPAQMKMQCVCSLLSDIKRGTIKTTEKIKKAETLIKKTAPVVKEIKKSFPTGKKINLISLPTETLKSKLSDFMSPTQISKLTRPKLIKNLAMFLKKASPSKKAAAKKTIKKIISKKPIKKSLFSYTKEDLIEKLKDSHDVKKLKNMPIGKLRSIFSKLAKKTVKVISKGAKRIKKSFSKETSSHKKDGKMLSLLRNIKK